MLKGDNFSSKEKKSYKKRSVTEQHTANKPISRSSWLEMDERKLWSMNSLLHKEYGQYEQKKRDNKRRQLEQCLYWIKKTGPSEGNSWVSAAVFSWSRKRLPFTSMTICTFICRDRRVILLLSYACFSSIWKQTTVWFTNSADCFKFTTKNRSDWGEQPKLW